MEQLQLRVVRLQLNNLVSRNSVKTSTVASSGAAVLFLVVGLLAGCVTKPVTEPSAKKAAQTGTEFGQWRGQGSASRMVTNDKGLKLENWTVNLEVVSRTPGFGRIEVTGAMGVYGGTIAWNKTETRILLPGQRKFVIAPNSTRSFLAILPFEISPSEVEAILFDRDFDLSSLKARGISCRRENDSKRETLSSNSEAKETCKNPDGFLLVRSRGFVSNSFEVKAADGARVKMELVPVRAKVEESDELWALESPRGFKVIQQ